MRMESAAQFNLQQGTGWPQVRASIDPELLSSRAWPKVSLVTPSFEQGAFLEATILSVLHQGYPDLEYFVFDAGSSDGSRAILERYHDRLTYWESDPDQGQSHAINKGWKRAGGEYVWWINSDDMLTPGSLFRSVAYLEDNPECGMVYGDLEIIDAAGALQGRMRYEDFIYDRVLETGQDISQAGGLMRRSCLDRVGFLNENFHFMMDLDFWHRLALSGIEIAHLPEPLALFRVYDETKTQASSPRLVEERYQVTKLITSHVCLREAFPGGENIIWSNTHLRCARGYAKAGEYAPGMRECWRSLLRYPGRCFSGGWWYLVFLNAAGLILGRKRWLRLRRWLRNRRAGRARSADGASRP